MKRLTILILIIASFFILIAGLVIGSVLNSVLFSGDTSFKITSPAFGNGSYIPEEYTCKGSNINPQLNIMNVPNGTESLAIVMDDPDALDIPWVGTIWVHWLVWNIDPETTLIEKNSTPSGAVVGINSFGRNDYGGPCPPEWRDHRYHFRLFAIDKELNLSSNSVKGTFMDAIEGHIIGQTALIGRFQKQENQLQHELRILTLTIFEKE